MSRIGRRPISLSDNVEVSVDGRLVRVKGPKGELARTVVPEVSVQVQDGRLLVERRADTPRHRALHGLTRTLLANMVQGVTQGFEKRLELQGVGYRAAKSGRNLTLSVGYSHPVEMAPPPGVEVEVPSPTVIVVKGADREQVGQFTANIRAVRPPEPYQGKGIRYAGEKVRRKVGKTGKK
jgi:large subunit ribosomal protein L6